jgi:hypothetical protein
MPDEIETLLRQAAGDHDVIAMGADCRRRASSRAAVWSRRWPT